MQPHRAWAEVDLDALAHNLAVIRRRAGAGVRLLLVVKADAYGHGAVAVAHQAARSGVGALGVGTSAEALELRQAGQRLPILVLGTVVEEELRDCLRAGVHIGLHASDRARQLEGLAQRMGLRAQVHLNVDTGMGRLGVPPALALDLLRLVQRSPHLQLAGVMTHVSSCDGRLDPGTAQQLATFQAVVAAARADGIDPGWVHALNSVTLFTGEEPVGDTVRTGIAAYGALPRHLPGARDLQPVMSLRTQVVMLKDVPQGTPVGYGSTWRAPRSTRIATLPIGYADGVPWSLSNRGEVLVHGRRAPVVGRVSMDYVTLDVGHVPGVAVGDVVTLFGVDGEAELRLEEVACRAGTIPYELTCAVGPRVHRQFVGDGDPLLPAQAPVTGPVRPGAPRGEPRLPGPPSTDPRDGHLDRGSVPGRS